MNSGVIVHIGSTVRPSKPCHLNVAGAVWPKTSNHFHLLPKNKIKESNYKTHKVITSGSLQKAKDVKTLAELFLTIYKTDRIYLAETEIQACFSTGTVSVSPSKPHVMYRDFVEYISGENGNFFLFLCIVYVCGVVYIVHAAPLFMTVGGHFWDIFAHSTILYDFGIYILCTLYQCVFGVVILCTQNHCLCDWS